MSLSPSAEVTVLHVDDDPDLLEVASAFVERADSRLSVVTETDVEAALTTLRDADVECVVSDYEMPEKNGLEFLEAVREEHPDLPFVLFTGKGSEEIASEAISAGVDDYIQKEAHTDQYALLANRVLTLVESRRSASAARRTEERYHNLVDAAPVPILLFGGDKQLVYANDAAAEFLHADSPAELQGRPFTEFLHPEDRERSEQRFRRLLEEGTPAPAVTYRVRTVDGTTKKATVATAPGQYEGQQVGQAIVRHPVPESME